MDSRYCYPFIIKKNIMSKETNLNTLDKKLYDIVLDPEAFIEETNSILTNEEQDQMVSIVMTLDTKGYFNQYPYLLLKQK